MNAHRRGIPTGLLVGVGGLVASLLLCCGAVVCWGPTLLGSFGDDRRAPREEPAPTWARGDRHSHLAAPGRPGRYEMDFADRSTGYVLFLNCARPCPATLYGTADGGRTWRHVPLDLDGADVLSLTVADPRKLAISTGLSRYHVSRDGGRTFVAEPAYPADFASTRGTKANLQCRVRDDDGVCQQYEIARGESPVPVQPPLPAGVDEVDAVTEDATGRIWAVTALRSTVHTAVSTDGGASWRSLPDLDTGFPLGPVELTAAPDDGEPWLVIGHDAASRLSAYRGGADRWRVVVEGQPVDVDWSRVVSAGGGAVAVYGERLGHLFDDGTWRTAPPTDVLGISRLADGSLIASTRKLQGVWSGTRAGTDFGWAHITVEPL